MEIAINKPLRPQFSGGFPDHQHFGMGRGVFQFQRSVSRHGQHLAIVGNQRRTNRHFPPGRCRVGLGNGKPHGIRKTGGGWLFLFHRGR